MAEEIKNFGDIFPKVDFDGEKTKIDELLGKSIVIKQYGMIPSSFGENKNFLVIQATIDDEKDKLVTFATGSSIIFSQLEKIKDQLPVRTTIIKPMNKRYYTLG